MNKIKAYILFCVILGYTESFAQTQVEVITKTVEKTIPLRSGYDVSLQGQGAKIFVGESESNDIRVRLKLISKGLTKSIAERELEYQKYAIDEFKKTVVIRNYLLLPSNKELSTIQETVMEVRIPKGVDLSITNSFGSIELIKLTGKMDIKNDYGDIIINDFNGECIIKGNYGDFKGSNLKGKLFLDTDHVEITLDSFTGTSKINSNLGNVLIKNPYQMKHLEINGEKSDITIETRNLKSYLWKIRSKYGSLDVPHSMQEADSDKSETKILSGNENQPLIELSTDFGDIMIKQQ
ncbi:DUF4097 family beta strand repeat-containing protein [Ekhidna sp.]